MANKTTIEWTDYNWNFLRGCSRVSEGCRNCYAEGIAARFSGYDKGKPLPYFGLAEMVNGKPRWTGEISFHEDVLLQPLQWKKPRRVFVNSMSDLFHEKVKDEWLDKAFAVMALTPQHTYQILTKRPERMKAYLSADDDDLCYRIVDQALTYSHNESIGNVMKWLEPHGEWLSDLKTWPLPNVHLGVSVEDQKTADERIPLLLQTPAAVRWISAEPMLGSIDLEPFLNWGRLGETWDSLDWVVVGGESGSNARPFDVAWARSIIEQCKAAGVACFVKQLGAKPMLSTHPFDDRSLRLENKKGGDMSEWPQDLRIREFPK